VKQHKQQIAAITTKVPHLTEKFVKATRLHWELVDVVDFFAQETAEGSRAGRKNIAEEPAERALISRAHTHLEQ
jgi:hypothetical protein